MKNIYAKYLNESVLNEKFSKKEIRDLFFNYAMEKELNTNILLSGGIINDIYSDYEWLSGAGDKKEEDLKYIFNNVVDTYSSDIREEDEMPIDKFEIGYKIDKNVLDVIGNVSDYLGTVYKKQYDKFLSGEEVLTTGKEGFMGYKKIKKYSVKKGGIALILDDYQTYGKTIFFNSEAYYNILNQLI